MTDILKEDHLWKHQTPKIGDLVRNRQYMFGVVEKKTKKSCKVRFDTPMDEIAMWEDFDTLDVYVGPELVDEETALRMLNGQ